MGKARALPALRIPYSGHDLLLDIDYLCPEEWQRFWNFRPLPLTHIYPLDDPEIKALYSK